MDLRRLRAGEWIVALSGVALLVSLSLPWYRQIVTCSRAPCRTFDHTGWAALAVNDVILAVIAVAAMSLFVFTATQQVPAVPIALISMLTLGGILATVLVAVRVIWLPDLANEREWGLWLALAGALGIATGSWIGVRDDRMAGSSRHAEVTVEHVPAPRP